MQVCTVSTNPATVATRGLPQITAAYINTETFTLQKDLSWQDSSTDFTLPSLANYQNQLRLQGQQEQSIVISKGGDIVASISQGNTATFQDSDLAGIWDKADGDVEVFTSTLKKAGYQITVYEQGAGPAYADIHQQIHGESYETLISRQTIEYMQEQTQLTTRQSYLNIVA